MAAITDLIDRVKVIATAAVTYLTAAVALLTLVAANIGDLLPDGQAQTVGAWIVRAVAVLVGAIAIIRRVTPVIPEDRGLLPPDRAVIPAAVPPNGV